MKTILIAAVPAAAAIVRDALGTMARMLTAHTLDEALAIAAGGVDLIIAGTYFDNARMFELLRLLKSVAATRDIPVLCVRGVSAPEAGTDAASPPILSSPDVIDSAGRALGAVGFIDLCARQRAMGTTAANAELARLAHSCLDRAG